MYACKYVSTCPTNMYKDRLKQNITNQYGKRMLFFSKMLASYTHFLT